MIVEYMAGKSKKLPNHVPINIDSNDIDKFNEVLHNRGYRSIFLQIIKPRQIIGRVKPIIRNDKSIEHHVRVFVDGTITSEYELPRVDQMWAHITTVSYSSHEQVIEFLEEANIDYTVDEELRKRYNEEAIDDYPVDYMEFVYWFFAGVLFWTPLGYIWRFFYNIKNRNHKSISIDEKSKLGTIGK